MITPRVLTISATYGAGGPVAGPLLAQRFGLPFVDRLLDPISARDPRRRGQARNEEDRSPLLKGLALLGATSNIPVPRDLEDLPERLRNLNEARLRELIHEPGAVILGRAAAVVLGRQPGAFHVRLDGPTDRRARRGAEWEGVDLETARARLEESDAARARSFRRLYDRDPAEPALYHLVLDATVMRITQLVDVIATAAEAAWGHDDATLTSDVVATKALLADLPPPPT